MVTIRALQPGRIVGTNSSDQIYSSYGDDIIYAGYGADTIYAGFGNDIISGVPSRYDDQYYEDDTVSYAYATSGAIIDLYYGWGSTSATQRDTYIEIDNAIGTNFGDFIYGDNTSNTLRGLDGNDVIWGGGGPDTMDGGRGTDWLDYYGYNGHWSATPVYVHMGTGEARAIDLYDGDQSSPYLTTNDWDTFVNFENVRGTGSHDRIYGDEFNNVIEGMEGDDHLSGGDGPGWDTVDGGAGNDDIYGGGGNDRLIGGIGDDVLRGGPDADTFVFDIQSSAIGQNPGHDTITDFRFYGPDRIRFDVTNPAAGMSELTIRQVGNNTVISYDDTGGSLTLEGVNASSLILSPSAFEFV